MRTNTKIEDVTIVGSGFGGSVMACRLAETGRFRVRVLERGPEYRRGDFPRSPASLAELTWDPERGSYGLFDVQRFGRASMDVVTGTGLGGGSLVYSNVLYRMPAEMFAGWPGGIDRRRLEPRYDRVIDMLEARPYPHDRQGSPYQRTPKTAMMARAAEVMAGDGLGQVATRLERPALAVTFGPQPGSERRNRHGATQTACSMCGQCNMGCNTHSKNTLDLTYLRRARDCGARIVTHADVQRIVARPGGGYEVTCSDPRVPGSEETIRSDRVILAAGALGSTRLLLRQRAMGHLPAVSAQLGRRWSPNGDLLAVYMTRDLPVDPSVGPVITSAIRFLYGTYPDGSPHEVYVEDGGFPDFLGWYFAAQLGRYALPHQRLARGLRVLRDVVAGRTSATITGAVAGALADEAQAVRNVLPLLAMGRDRSTGVLSLRPGSAELELAWDARDERVHYQRTREALRRVGDAIGAGALVENPLSFASQHVTVHPLGGCPIGTGPGDGVVDARTGEVFGHPGLHIVDGSVLPSSIGPNPSLTIAALAELFAEAF